MIPRIDVLQDTVARELQNDSSDEELDELRASGVQAQPQVRQLSMLNARIRRTD